MNRANQRSADRQSGQFLSNLNSPDPLRKSNQLLEEILGKKLKQLNNLSIFSQEEFDISSRRNQLNMTPPAKPPRHLAMPIHVYSDRKNDTDQSELNQQKNSMLVIDYSNSNAGVIKDTPPNFNLKLANKTTRTGGDKSDISNLLSKEIQVPKLSLNIKQEASIYHSSDGEGDESQNMKMRKLMEGPTSSPRQLGTKDMIEKQSDRLDNNRSPIQRSLTETKWKESNRMPKKPSINDDLISVKPKSPAIHVESSLEGDGVSQIDLIRKNSEKRFIACGKGKAHKDSFEKPDPEDLQDQRRNNNIVEKNKNTIEGIFNDQNSLGEVNYPNNNTLLSKISKDENSIGFQPMGIGQSLVEIPNKVMPGASNIKRTTTMEVGSKHSARMGRDLSPNKADVEGFELRRSKSILKNPNITHLAENASVYDIASLRKSNRGELSADNRGKKVQFRTNNEVVIVESYKGYYNEENEGGGKKCACPCTLI